MRVFWCTPEPAPTESTHPANSYISNVSVAAPNTDNFLRSARVQVASQFFLWLSCEYAGLNITGMGSGRRPMRAPTRFEQAHWQLSSFS